MTWKAPPFPSERKLVEHRGPVSWLAPLPRPWPSRSSISSGWAKSLQPSPSSFKVGALTVAGQWRIYTAFPSILTIAVVPGTTRIRAARLSWI